MGRTVKGLGLGACITDAYSVGVPSGVLFQPLSESVCLASYETTQAVIRHHELCCISHNKWISDLRMRSITSYLNVSAHTVYCVHLTLDTPTVLEHFASDAASAVQLPKSGCTCDCKPLRSFKVVT